MGGVGQPSSPKTHKGISRETFIVLSVCALAESAVRGADRCGVCCEVTLTGGFIDADDIFGILSAS